MILLTRHWLHQEGYKTSTKVIKHNIDALFPSSILLISQWDNISYLHLFLNVMSQEAQNSYLQVSLFYSTKINQKSTFSSPKKYHPGVSLVTEDHEHALLFESVHCSVWWS